MQAGQLRRKVIIQVNSPTQDARGEPDDAWSTAWTIWAAIYPQTGSETKAGEQTVPQITHKIRIRYSSTISGITPAHRILWGTRIFEINFINRPQEHQRFLDLMCIETQLT